MNRTQALERTIAFLNGIGLPTQPAQEAKGFLEHIRIKNGILLFNPEHATAANLLHEAGHLAVLPSRLRHTVNDDLEHTFDKLADILDQEFDLENPDKPEIRALLQCGETEATAWAWAAGKAIGLPDEMIIEDQDYDNNGAEIRLCLSCNSYLGINGLVGGYMLKNVKSYPELLRWLQI